MSDDAVDGTETQTDPASGSETEAQPGIEDLLTYLRDSRGFDFTGYKRSTLARRITRRIQATGASDYSSYRDHLEAEPDEVTELFNTILINVTSFFRDPELWQELTRRIVPQLLRRATPEQPLRVWSAGCAAGQEAYSIAMVFAEALDGESPRELVKIYATDIDDDALATARRAWYSEREVEEVPPELLERYFEPAELDGVQGYSFSTELRRCVIFGRHNLISDAPISRVDLLLCRNTLMYFNAALQRDVVRRLHFSLAPHGYLVLGKVEMLLGHRTLLQPEEGPVRIFTRLNRPDLRAGDLSLLERAGTSYDGDPDALPVLAFAAGTIAQTVVDDRGRLVLANDAARGRFGLTQDDIGRPFQDLELSYRPVELRSHIDGATRDRHQVSIKDVRTLGRDGQPSYLDVLVTPLLPTGDGPVLGTVIAFIDVTHHHDLQEQLEEAHHDLETAYEELQSTNEELETTNEELQSTIEELETTNEELRSTNEEFETMNDELQAVNDELAVRNRSLQERSGELTTARRYFQAVLDSVRAGLVVIDRDLNVLTWNAGAEDLWGARADEAQGRSLLSLDIGLPLEQLAAPIREVLAGDVEERVIDLSAHNRRGRPIRCRVKVSPMQEEDGDGGVLLVMEPTLHEPGA